VIGSGSVLLIGSASVVAIRGTAAVSAGQARAGGWPFWRSGPAALALVLHDVVIGAGVYAALAVLPTRLLERQLGSGGWPTALLALLGSAAALLLGPILLRRRHGVPLLLGVAGPAGPESRHPLREGLLLAVERGALRAVSRWIAAQADDCRRSGALTAEMLLPAVWPAVRWQLRDSIGAGRTELALLLLQAQAAMDDPAPATDRLLTLLHLVQHHAGRSGVRQALDQARQTPVRHGRAGSPGWGPGLPVGAPRFEQSPEPVGHRGP
jgi:hypothetical protein